MAETTEKLTKKQRKALEFRTKSKKKETTEGDAELTKDVKDQKKRKREEDDTTSAAEATTTDAEPKKKRKTRRGKKGKGQGGAGPRFLLFVGNLPYDIKQAELVAHFAASSPDTIRIRTEKGIAFLEFDPSGDDIRKRMDVALKMHHSTLRQRKINVELTAGGGGNSKTRLEKIKTKNEKVDEERREDIKKKKEERSKKSKPTPTDLKGVHPDRAKAMMRN